MTMTHKEALRVARDYLVQYETPTDADLTELMKSYLDARGLVMVPREPTEGMRAEFFRNNRLNAAWSAMLAAAPDPFVEGVCAAGNGTAPPPSQHLRGDQHPDDLAVDRFAAAMKAKLAKKRDEGRGGWQDKEHCSNAFLSRLLVEHVQKGDPVDVANIAMMIHQRGESICVLTERVAAIAQLHAIVDAWEALPGGRQVKNSDVERWLAKHMGPGIDAIRGFLRRPRPDGILPPSPQPRAVG
jgi:hypothetical protein